PFGAHRAIRFAADPDQEKARRHLANALEEGEYWCSPGPLLDREVRQVRARHEQQEQHAKGERPTEEEPSVRSVCQRVRAVDAEQHARYQRHFDERKREPAEGARLLDMPLDGVTWEKGHW